MAEGFDVRLTRAQERYEQAVFGGDATSLDAAERDRQDQAAADPAFARARELATEAGDELTLSYVLRHLCLGEQAAGRVDAARELLEESTRLRRKLTLLPNSVQAARARPCLVDQVSRARSRSQILMVAMSM
ncbi:hypothetical protein ACLQ24_19685, partial [Micromonospora sp. DT4]